MGLTSEPFIGLMIVVALVSLALTLWAWPRVAGRGVTHVAGRLGMITVSQALVIAAFLFWLNGYFAFYGSWSQLLGHGRPGGLAGALRPGTAASLVLVTSSRPGPSPGRAARPPLAAQGTPGGGVPAPGPGSGPGVAGRLLQVTIRGQRTGLSSGTGYVYLPPQYFRPAYARTRFPVVLTLTGYPGVAKQLVTRLAVPATVAGLLAAGQIRPAVYVMLNVSPLLPLDTECTDIPAGPQVESFFAQDVPDAIEQRFRVSTGAAGWGVLGYSEGGYCAAKLAMMYPGRFSAAVSMAGYYTASGGHGIASMWGGSLALRNENSPDWRLRHLPAPPVSVLVTSSRIGEPSLPGTLRFLRLIHAPMRGYSFFVPQGGHNFRTWGDELAPSLGWLSRRLR